MTFQSILLSAIGVIVTGLAAWISERLVAWINEKIKNNKAAKYASDAISVVSRAVKTTYQTYVGALKDKDAFTKEAQKNALEKAKDMAIAQLSGDTKEYIQSTFGDIGQWVEGTIESIIYDLKG